MRIVADNFWLCSDCTFVACNGPHGGEFSDLPATLAGLETLGPHLVAHFDSSQDVDFPDYIDNGVREFSGIPCASCKTPLVGYRARFAQLG
jgi:hypothetical protein